MARILDLTTDDDAASVLAETDASGLISSGHLVDAPLSTHLADGETARYLVESKKGGLVVRDGDDERTYAPDDDYRAFALVTDRRILFVAGRAGGDETVSLPLADVLEADADRSGFISSALVAVTHDGRRYQFPCRGDLDAVVETINDDAAAWSHAERLLEDADAAVERARNRLEAGNHVEALAGMADASSYWEEALAALEPVHQSAVQGLHERVAVRREMASRLRRQIRAAAGASAHASAQRAWQDRSYERAAAAYEDAADAYEASRERPGDVPTDEQLARRLAGVARERAVLRAAPVVDADAAARRAAGIDDPERAAEAWAQALDRFRAALELEWGASGRRFEVDREATRESAADAAAAAIDARLEAGRQWLAAGDELASAEGVQAAERAYHRARTHVEHAGELADEVRPDRQGEIDDWFAAIDDRLAGEIDLDEAAHDAPLPVDSIADALSILDGDEAADGALPGDGPQSPDATSAVPVRAPEADGADASAGSVPGDDPADDDGPADDAAGDEGGHETDADDASPAAVADAIEAADGPWDDADEEFEAPAVDPAPSGGEAEAADRPPAGPLDVEEAVAGARDVDLADFGDALVAMGPDAFSDLVARVWRARGWSTTIFTESGESVYDVLAVDPGGDRRLLIWTSHRPDDGAVDRSVIERSAATRDRSKGADLATVVTTGSVPPAVEDRAEDLAVAVVDGEGLRELLVATGTAEAVLDEYA